MTDQTWSMCRVVRIVNVRKGHIALFKMVCLNCVVTNRCNKTAADLKNLNMDHAPVMTNNHAPTPMFLVSHGSLNPKLYGIIWLWNDVIQVTGYKYLETTCVKSSLCLFLALLHSCLSSCFFLVFSCFFLSTVVLYVVFVSFTTRNFSCNILCKHG